ncbi:unnamed protein product [Microthlaspi erraticum]|uniref:F-box domain-containing protein n=1 Tax=Microthlaspi erraticum TaxID=1685480 RepID=A0A6D2JG90_9BRAS|nr:unnamed protein product [Microthlaspi erraticum]
MNGAKLPVTETMTFLMLPNDLLFNCLARISRLYYPILSLVSKRFRYLLASLELYETRTLLGCTESCLYVCLFMPDDHHNPSRWFTLCRRPTKITNPNPNPNPRWFSACFRPYGLLMNCIRKKDKSSDNALVSITTRHSPFNDSCGLTAVGCNIYRVGNFDDGKPSRRVLLMDCRSHTWKRAPSMRVARKDACVSVLDGKIYVVGGNRKCDSSNWMECFDPQTQKWENLTGPDAEMRESWLHQDLAIEGKLYLSGYTSRQRCVVYKTKEKRWDEVEVMKVPSGWLFDSSCVIDNVLYSFRWPGVFKWYHFEGRSWRVLVLKGLKKLSRLLHGSLFVYLVDSGGKIAVLGEKEVGEEKKIWCAEIALEKRNGQEVRGKVEWCHVVLTVPKSCYIMQFLAVTV